MLKQLSTIYVEMKVQLHRKRSASRHSPLPRENNPRTHLTGGWLGSRTSLLPLPKILLLFLCRPAHSSVL
jgi:hypothetical protein